MIPAEHATLRIVNRDVMIAIASYRDTSKGTEKEYIQETTKPIHKEHSELIPIRLLTIPLIRYRILIHP